MLPMIETAEDARKIFRLLRYPPVGDRTLCSTARASGHGTQRHEFGKFLDWSNDSIATVCLMETPRGVENVEAIIAEGIDVLMLGRGARTRATAPASATRRTKSRGKDRGVVRGVAQANLN